MRKTTWLGLGLGLALTLGAGDIAAQGTRPDRPRAERSDARRGPDGDRASRRGGPDGMLLNGITLTDEQTARIEELRSRQATAMQASRARYREAMQAARAARASGDTAAARTQVMALRQEMEQVRAGHLASLRGVLTAEQQTQFDANVAKMEQRRQERGSAEGRRPRGGKRPQHQGARSR